MATIGKTIRELEPASWSIKDDDILAISNPSGENPDIAYKVTVQQLGASSNPDVIDAKTIRVSDSNQVSISSEATISVVSGACTLASVSDFENINVGDSLGIGSSPFSSTSLGTVVFKGTFPNIGVTLNVADVGNVYFTIFKTRLYLGSFNTADYSGDNKDLSRVSIGALSSVFNTKMGAKEILSLDKVDTTYSGDPYDKVTINSTSKVVINPRVETGTLAVSSNLNVDSSTVSIISESVGVQGRVVSIESLGEAGVVGSGVLNLNARKEVSVVGSGTINVGDEVNTTKIKMVVGSVNTLELTDGLYKVDSTGVEIKGGTSGVHIETSDGSNGNIILECDGSGLVDVNSTINAEHIDASGLEVTGDITFHGGEIKSELAGSINLKSGAIETESGNISTSSGNIKTASGNILAEGTEKTENNGHITAVRGNIYAKKLAGSPVSEHEGNIKAEGNIYAVGNIIAQTNVTAHNIVFGLKGLNSGENIFAESGFIKCENVIATQNVSADGYVKALKYSSPTEDFVTFDVETNKPFYPNVPVFYSKLKDGLELYIPASGIPKFFGFRTTTESEILANRGMEEEIGELSKLGPKIKYHGLYQINFEFRFEAPAGGYPTGSRVTAQLDAGDQIYVETRVIDYMYTNDIYVSFNFCRIVKLFPGDFVEAGVAQKTGHSRLVYPPKACNLSVRYLSADY